MSKAGYQKLIFQTLPSPPLLTLSIFYTKREISYLLIPIYSDADGSLLEVKPASPLEVRLISAGKFLDATQTIQGRLRSAPTTTFSSIFSHFEPFFALVDGIY
jgi:hypothetical protein